MSMRTLIMAIGTIVAAGNTQAQPPGQVGDLAEGQGKELVQTLCFGCHTAFNIIGSAGYDTPENWRTVFSTMIDLGDAQANTIATYLAEHYPAQPGRAPVLIDGPTEIEITEWQAPTLGQRSRDPVEAPDGSIWWTGMYASLVGRLDPATGAMEEFRLPFSARPHSIVPDAQGNIWYTGNSNGTIGKLDPATGLITQYPTQASDPRTATFHPNGDLYFTAQNSNMLGRLNPQTGELKEIQTEARPYGIQVAASGTVWIAYNGTNKIGVLDPATGNVKEWDSPSGPQSQPYALAVINDKVWYNESGMRPDTLVRFDPQKEQFQSWAIPSGVGIVRNMWVTQDNNLLIHQSSTNKIGLVTIKN